MKALILAGGTGTRLYPLTYTQAKQLIPVANKPILFYCLEYLTEAGIKEVGIVVGKNTCKKVKEAVGNGEAWNLAVTYIYQEEPLGLAHGVKISRSFLGDSPFVMYLGDNLLLGGIKPFVEAFKEKKPAAMVLLKKVKNPEHFGIAELGDEGEILGLVEKPVNPKSDLALVGVYLFQKDMFSVLDILKPSWRGEYEITDAIQLLIEEGKDVEPFILEDWWKDAGKKEDLLEANAVILERLSAVNEGTIVNSTLHGKVGVGKGTCIVDSIIKGPVILGSGVCVKNSCLGPYTSIASGVEIIGTEISNSIVMANSRIHGLAAKIEDSLLGEKVLIESRGGLPHSLVITLGDSNELVIR